MRELGIMFTANEMVTAIANDSEANSDLLDRFERAAFAEHLANLYGADDGTAAELLVDIITSKTRFEGDRITFWRRDLIEWRYELARYSGYAY